MQRPSGVAQAVCIATDYLQCKETNMLVGCYNASNPPPKPRIVKIAVEYTFEIWKAPDMSDDELAKAMETNLHRCCEGRFPFRVELLREGIEDALKSAVYLVIQAQEVEKHRGEFLSHPGGQTATWAQTTAEKFKDVTIFHTSLGDVEVKTCDTK